MARFDLGDVLGSVLGGAPPARGTTRRRRSTRGQQDLGRALAVLAGVAIEAMTRSQSQPAPPPAPVPPRGKGGAWGSPPPATKPRPAPGGPKSAPAGRSSVPATGPWGGTATRPAKPAPSDAWSPVPGAPTPPPIAAEDREGLLMLRAMVAAAQADGQVDAEERERIAGQLEAAGLGSAARDAVLAEFGRTTTAEALAREAGDPMLAAQLYAAAVAGAGTIGGGERTWLDAFARALRLDRAATEAIERRIIGG